MRGNGRPGKSRSLRNEEARGYHFWQFTRISEVRDLVARARTEFA
jgi:hypothetical protein